MIDFYRGVLQAMEKGGCALVSIVQASGSAPRGIGAKMLVTHDGCASGTIGGGAVEHAAQQLAGTAILEKRSYLKEYRLSPNQVSDLGMVCGGDITVWVEYLDPADVRQKEFIAYIVDCHAHNRQCTLVTEIQGERCTSYLAAESSPFAPPQAVPTGETAPRVLQLQDAAYVVEPLVTGNRVLVFGAGHVGKELSFFLRRLQYYHVMIDDRAEFLTPQNLPCADQRRELAFPEAVESLRVTERDNIVIMTRGHLHDYSVLRDALKTPARYIGMIGSRTKVKVALDKLRGEGVSEKEIARIHAPIGIPLGGKTPEEVALSVCAELVRIRNGYGE